MGTEECYDDRDIPSNALATLRGILISSLSRENLGNIDVQSSTSHSRRRKVTFQELYQVDAGAAPVDAALQRPSSAPQSSARSSTPQKGHSGTLHWFAYIGNEAESTQNDTISSDSNLLDHGEDSDDADSLDGTTPLDFVTDPGKESNISQKEREERIRALRDRQNEERQRKLEELKQQALAAQKFREQKEEERRRRIEELRQRDNDRRHQVEERKRQIWEAERDRREAILRKNQEREARIDSKRKNERSSIVFAFGSSTPRMLEPADTGGSFWGTRRATSTSNVMMFTAMPLTRRSSERELDGSKKRATSASGLDRKPGEDMKMSTSMYEVFHWNSTPEPPRKPNQRAKSLSYASGSEPKISSDRDVDSPKTISMVPTELSLNLDGPVRSFSSAPHTPTNRSVRIGSILSGFGGLPGGEEGETGGAASPVAPTVQQRVNRRKTDLMPTIPSPRDLTPTSSSKPSGTRPFSKSPGRAYSMSRLDQLSQPRRRADLTALHEKPSAPSSTLGSSPTTAKSMSRSMSHLAGNRQLRKSDASRSMSQLSGGGQTHPVPPPRTTRAERLRQKARDMATSRQGINSVGSTNQLPGLRSGEITPTPPSRPLSALSQQSMSSVNSGVSLRARPVTAPRRPRPISIAVTGVTHESEIQAARTSHRHSIAGDIRTPKAQSSSVEREGAKPPLPKVHSAKKVKSEVSGKREKALKSAKASPRMTPKSTPLQSPGTEAVPILPQSQAEAKEEIKETKKEVTEKTEEVVQDEMPIESIDQVEEEAKSIEVEAEQSVEDIKSKEVEKESLKQAETEEKKEKETAPAAPAVETEEKTEATEQNELGSEMTASMIAKARITTEEEAKAALAERRRLAREQAEREAELERQRLEEERRREEERLRQEEEEQRRFEEEQLRLVEEARRAEEERLLQAIQENQRREEEEKKRREEEARARAEKEEAERKAREEAERLRREMDERLKKEEEERIARRKRVEAIMLRTRGKGSTPSSTPTKGEGENEETKEESPSEESKSKAEDTTASASGSELQQKTEQASEDQLSGNGQISLQQQHQNISTDSFKADIMDHIQENGGSEKKKSSSSSSDLLLIDNSNNMKPMETSEDVINSATSVLPPSSQQSNGHRNGVEYGAVDFVSVDNVKQINETNNLLDFSEFSSNNVMLNASQQPTSTTSEFEQILDLNTVPTTGKLANEDNVNSNIMNNRPAAPFIAFQDNLAKKPDTNSVADLLS